MSGALIRLVDELSDLTDQHCTLCGAGESRAPFLLLPIPQQLLAAAGVGEFVLCQDCFSFACTAGGVVAQGRFDATVERAQEAEASLARAASADSERVATIDGLKRELAKV